MPVNNNHIWTNVEIILCPDCKGAGEIHKDELVDYHKRDYITRTSVCRKCDGSGRLKKITKIEYKNI